LAKKSNYNKKTDNKKTDNKKTDNKKTDNKKTDNKKTDNKKIFITLVICVMVSTFALFLFFDGNSESSTNLPEPSLSISDYLANLSETHTNYLDMGNPFFYTYFTDDDVIRTKNNLAALDGLLVSLNELYAKDLIAKLKPNDRTVVIYPTFTSAAYKEPGFYTYFGGFCNESCITDVSFEVAEFKYTSTGFTAQILYLVGYDFLTDIDIDQNPELLQNYDTVILLHNEYVTKKEFDAITSHPKLIFLAPNALYAEIDVDYDSNTMTLIRGHNYPESEIHNGFDYAIEEEFHHYEYDNTCLEWKFIEIENGFHLNCYPDAVIHKNLDILLKMKEL
jgi:hypothetical protein